MFGRFFKGLAGLLLGLCAVAVGGAVFFGAIYYIGLGVFGFAAAFSTRYDIPQGYIYASPFVFVPLWFGIDAVVQRIPKRAWKTRVAVDGSGALALGLFVGLAWTLGIAGLLTGPGPYTSAGDFGMSGGRVGDWILWALTHSPSLSNPGVSALIGLAIALPMAARAFWSIAPFWYYDGQIRIHYRPRDQDKRVAPGAAARARPVAPTRARPATTVGARPAPVRSAGPSRAGGHVRVGMATGIATFASVSAGWNDGPKLFQVILSLVASAGTGTIAALQWRASTGESRK